MRAPPAKQPPSNGSPGQKPQIQTNLDQDRGWSQGSERIYVAGSATVAGNSRTATRLARPDDPSPGEGSDSANSRGTAARWYDSKRDQGCLPDTIRRYRWVVGRARTYLLNAGRPTEPRDWTADDARWLRRCLHEDPWQLAILADLARFSRNLVFNEVGLPRRGPPLRVRWLSKEAIEAIFEVTRQDRLLRLVALLGVGQGLRRIEWLRLRAADIDLPGNRLLVRGKGRGRPKLVWMPLHPALPSALQEYLGWRRRTIQRFVRDQPVEPVPEELLLHRRGSRLVPYGIGGANRWMRIIDRRLRTRGIDVTLSTHMLRRSGATLLERTLLRSPEASKDGVYRVVQGFLRHESLATTMRYLEADPRRQESAMKAFGSAIRWHSPDDGPLASDRRPGARPGRRLQGRAPGRKTRPKRGERSP